MSAGRARIFTDPRCLLHVAPPGFPEVPERLRGILDALGRDGWEVRSGCHHERRQAAVVAVHDERYLERFRRASERGDGLLDSADNPLGEETWAAAWAAVETVLEAADWVLEAPGRRALAAVRPPGHHAEAGHAMGFCYLNNVAVAAAHLIAHHGLERVAIFDFDVHHGNGTQHIFERRPDVFFASVHQFPFYPGTGASREIGRGAGVGTTLNLPLPAGTGDDGYREAIEGRVLPALREFQPRALLVSAGFDAWRADPLGGMSVTADGFAEWGRRLAETADELCDGRVLCTLEGGYDLDNLPRLVRRFLAEL